MMERVLDNVLCDLNLKFKINGKKAGICDGVPSTAFLLSDDFFNINFFKKILSGILSE